MKRTLDAHYTHPKLAGIYDRSSGWSVDREFYLSLAGNRPIRILDLGCGTGLICNAYAAGNHQVTGVDPAESMLAVARRKPHGQKIEWVCCEAQEYHSEKFYDLIIMTGHAFQVLLEEEDVSAVFSVMRKHLAVGGTIVFESRNPFIDWQAKWNTDTALEGADPQVREERRVTELLGNRIRFDTRYHFADETLLSKSELRFWTHQEIEDLLTRADLEVQELYGNWDQSPYIRDLSEEMIFVVKAISVA
jgi:2-polyprenyl-3-methyl-5-hydroxy-6-metoxy-1,4-benzoquinol methylase